MDASKKIEEQAAAWLVRRDSGEWSGEDQTGLDAWLEESTGHVVAYIRLETAWQEMQRLKSLGAGSESNAVPSPDDWILSPVVRAPRSKPKHARGRWRPKRPWALAAGLVLAVALGLGVQHWSSGSAYQTPIGGRSVVPTADGSRITLNTDSSLRVNFSAHERRVTLRRGEAYFEVAKDPSRPFVVVAGDKRVVAVGTAFTVRRDHDDVRVAVAEGSVRISSESAADVLLVQGAMLPTGTVASAERSGLKLRKKSKEEVQDDLSWRTGYLVFRNTTLIEAVAEFNRYNERQIVIQDPELAAVELTGKFSVTKYDAFIRLLERSFPIQVMTEGDRVVLSRK
ncbi:FecR family protein [Steroidobacter sp.]|uniref:FecR family protein n=1 Tax=Steroidobacter sp. TaxID=1978227 RepID=UPI001A54835E|nr:FecR family protein [Steroidobacter sp.]